MDLQARFSRAGSGSGSGVDRVLLRGADVLLLDEPTAGLDPAAKVSLRDLLVRLARKHLIIVIDHEGLFDDVADQIIEL